MNNPNDKQKPTIRVERRRPSGPAQPGERQRAEAPRRQRPGEGSSAQTPYDQSGGLGGGQRPPSTSGGGLMGGSGRQLSPRMMLILLGILVCMAVVGIPLGLLQNSQSPDQSAFDIPTEPINNSQPQIEPTLKPSPTRRPTSTPKSVTGSTSTGEEPTWLVMLYQDADDKILEQDIFIDFNEAERVGSTDKVQIVAQLDRYRGGYTGDGDWTGTRRYFISKDEDLNSIGSEEVADLGEVNMSDGATLLDFVTWAMQNYPADKYALILSDHGMGWPGGWSDSDPRAPGDRSIPLSRALGDELYLMELDQTFDEIRAQTGLDKFDLIGMDACLMGHLEVFTALAPYARFAVASQETEPSLGWAYTSFLKGLVDNPGMDTPELTRLIVDGYVSEDQRLVDPQARAEFMRQGSPMGSFFDLMGSPQADQLARQLESNITITAVDLGNIPELNDSVNTLSTALTKVSQDRVARARNYAQSFTSIFGKEVPPSYIDLGNFVQILNQEIRDANVSQSATQVQAAIQKAVIAEKHGPEKSGASGISIYFPNSQLYQNPAAGPQSYTAMAQRFAEESLWDDFLAFHYTGRTFQPESRQAVVPESGVPVRGPGAAVIEVSPITLSRTWAAPGQPVLLSADIKGQNIGYVYLFVGFFDEQANSIFVADMDYLASPNDREVGGVYYPDWGESGDFTLQYEWEPLMFSITDGQDSQVALLAPQSYGASAEEAVYTVEGTYIFGDSGETRQAMLLLSNGLLRQVIGFTGEKEASAPREITPQSGDRFTLREKWLDLDSNGNVTQEAYQDRGTLTFSDQTFQWQEMDAAVGNYIIGLIVEDLDGNQYPVYTNISVR